MSLIDMNKAVIIADESSELFEDLFKMVIDSLPEKYMNLEKALHTEDSSQVEMYSHQFKGALRNLAALESVELLEKMEHAAEKGNLELAKGLYPQMKDSVERLLSFFHDGSWRTYFST